MQNFGGVAVPLAVASLVVAVPNFLLNFGRGFALGMLGSSVDPIVLTIVNLVGGLITYVIMVALQAYITSGVTLFVLKVARGERPEFGVVFSGGRYFATMLGGSFLFSLGVLLGLPFCVVPALFLAGQWLFYSFYIVDKGMSPVAALTASWQATAPYRVNALVFILLAFVVSFVGVLACFFGALLVSYPVVMVGAAYIYLKLIGEQPRLPA